MRKYDELYTAIKNDRKKSAPTFNQELLKMFLLRRKKESGPGTKKLFDQKGKKRPYRCMDELKDDTDDEDHDENDVVTRSMNISAKAQALLIGSSVNNYSDIPSEFAYHAVKKEPV
jgi:hypothetical protein